METDHSNKITNYLGPTIRSFLKDNYRILLLLDFFRRI